MPGKSAADRILDAIRAVPPGQVAGYGEIARRAGLPGGRRMVARLLAGTGRGPALAPGAALGRAHRLPT
jgi:alkylated DNA nucleotide flippase Atl1